MKSGRASCTDCGRPLMSRDAEAEAPEGACPTCGAPLEGGALSEFANRLARFGLGTAPPPLLNRVPESPDAK